MEQLITLKTAKAAKKKGFNEYCKNGYINNEHLRKYHVAGEGLESWGNYHPEFTLPFDASGFLVPAHEPWYKAPTQAELQKWLREQHKICVDVFTNYNADGFIYHVKISFIKDDTFDYIWITDFVHKDLFTPKIYKKYEQALEAGLQRALKMI